MKRVQALGAKQPAAERSAAGKKTKEYYNLIIYFWLVKH